MVVLTSCAPLFSPLIDHNSAESLELDKIATPFPPRLFSLFFPPLHFLTFLSHVKLLSATATAALLRLRAATAAISQQLPA